MAEAIELGINWRSPDPAPAEFVDAALDSLTRGDTGLADWLYRCADVERARGQQGLSIPANPRSLTGSIKSMDAHLKAIGHDYGANDIHHVEIDSAMQIIDSVYQIHRYKDCEITG